jgi:hypothetical protein
MDLDYWKTYYLLAEPEAIAEKVRSRLAALDKTVTHIIFNPMNWSLEQLELIATEVIPRIDPKGEFSKQTEMEMVILS